MTVTEATEIDELLRDKILESDGHNVQSSVFDILGVHAFNNPKWPMYEIGSSIVGSASLLAAERGSRATTSRFE